MSFLEYSCGITNTIPEREKLVVENNIYVNNERIYNDSEYKNVILTNENYDIFFVPVGLLLSQKLEKNPEGKFDTIEKRNPFLSSFLEKIFSKKALITMKKNYIELNNKIRDEYSEEPILLKKENVSKSIENLENYFLEHGYLDANVKTDVSTKNGSGKIINYIINTGDRYKIRNIKFDTKSPEIEISFKNYKSDIKSGDFFDYNLLSSERLNISNYFSNNGFYFFDPSRIAFELDTTAREKKVDIYIIILEKEEYKNDIVTYKNHNKYKISEVRVFIDYKYDTTKNIYNTLTYNDYTILYNQENIYSTEIITNNILYSKGEYYSSFNDRQTRMFINRLNNFRSVDTKFIVDTLNKELVSEIRLTPSPRYWINYEFLASTSNILEFGVEFLLFNGIRNMANMADIFNITFSGTAGNYRGFLNTGFLGSFIFRTSVNWTFPKFIIPFEEKFNYAKRIRPRTEFNLSFDYQRNIGLDKRNFTFNSGIVWNENEYKEHKIIFPSFRFTKYLNPQNYFNFYISEKNKLSSLHKEVMGVEAPANKPYNELITDLTSFFNGKENTQEYKQLIDILFRYMVFTSDMFIPSLKYIFTYNNLKKKSDWTFFKLELESSGNIFIPIFRSMGAIKSDTITNNYIFFGEPVSNHAKIDINLIKYWRLYGDYAYLAFKSFIGIGIPLGKTSSIPYQEMYFSGGTNNERAWLAYDLGPGGNKEKLFSLNVADIKLSFSLEYRHTIYKSFKGAAFIDAGNIWRYYELLEGENGDLEVFKWNRFYKELAVGIGYGIRYDMDAIAIRLDMAYKMFDPSKEEGNRYVLSKQSVFSPTLQFGITYPF